MADQEILAELRASAPRRWMGVAIMAALGGLLIYIALVTPPEVLAWQAFLLVLGGLSLWLAQATRRATELTLTLTEEGIVDSAGETVAQIGDIEGVSRGMFAMKPSNGFTLRLRRRDVGRWRPGLWWRFGKRVGIGGVTPGPQSKMMAQMIEALVAQRGPGHDA
ncbi:MAG: hypothetical protein OQK00_03970 [Rhodobacteraceae bacterium]|nr:hypothetical protein [Paracoccaceae bacterium]MCW9042218.1 hypothetical protein [Pseudopelagicola sp.]